MKINCSLHDLKAEDLEFADVIPNGRVAAIDSSTGVQFHWESLDDFDAWIDRLHNFVHAKAVAA